MKQEARHNAPSTSEQFYAEKRHSPSPLSVSAKAAGNVQMKLRSIARKEASDKLEARHCEKQARSCFCCHTA